MSQETELKLLLRAQDLPRLRRLPLLMATAPLRERLFNTYFDTPDLSLRAERVAVRERRIGRRTLLTVKTAGRSAGGLSVRGEWEAPTRPGQPDFRALMGDHPLADRLCAAAGRLVPIFRTDFVRHSWTITHGDALIELALDEGEVSTGVGANARRRPLLELELELKSGPASALHDLAQDLALPRADATDEGLWLMPSDLSKAQRGMALFESAPPEATGTAAPTLTPEMSLSQAFQATAWHCLAALQANLIPLALDPDSWQQPEFVHQSRIALRRLRGALQLFSAGLPPRFVSHWSRHWSTLASQLGAARDWDVLAATWLPKLLPAADQRTQALHWVQTQRSSAHAQARMYLTHPALTHGLLAFARGLQALPDAEPTPKSETLDRWASRQLARTHRALRRQARAALQAGPDARHELRLVLKRERYAIDALNSLLPVTASQRATRVLAKAQDVLGGLNDLDTARARLADAPSPWGPAVRERIARLERRELKHLPALERRLQNLALSRR